MSKPKIEKNVFVPLDVLTELLTPSEVRMLKNRWEIVSLLEEGLTIRKIAEKAKVGTDTVVRIARMAERKNLRKILDKENKRTFKTKTPWIFGKTE